MHCERLADGDIDAAIASIGSATLARTPEGSFVEVDDRLAENARRLLAFAGVRGTDSSWVISPRRGSCPAIGRDLRPLPRRALELDLLHVRSLPLGAETARLLRSRPWRSCGPTQRARVRDLLRGVDIVVGWRRRAWATKSALRSADARRVLRPVVFDLAAIGSPPEHRALAGDAAIGRWLFG
jgi:hypothetical protein